ncbi:MAG TPA: phosphatidylglycerophosphatase A [Burkholderiales bacterium]|nr:phosphatidylglycerophosphatase A [Burkholderiales bacterium]
MSANAIPRPGVGFLLSHPAHFIALGFGTGLSPFAPGTVGTLLAFPLYAVLAYWFAPVWVGAAIAAFFLIGIPACGRTGRDLGIADHGGMNWDEIVAFLGVLVFTPAGLAWQAAAFVGFRFFDIAKPPPIRSIDRSMKGGLGVMLDDMVAGFYTVLAIAVAKRLLA